MQKKLIVAPSPFLRNSKASTRGIMLDVIIALLPTALAAVWFFGTPALSVMVTCVIGCVVSEWAYQKITHQTSTIGDLSAVVTGLLLAFNMPASAPWWMALIGSVIAIVLVKQIFGGIGQNFMNPALAARTILMLSWTVLMAANVMPHAGQVFGLEDKVKAITATPAAIVETVEVETTTEATGAATGETAAAEPVEAAPVAAEATTEATGAATGETAAAEPVEDVPVAAEATTEATGAATGDAAAAEPVEAAPVAAEATTEATGAATGETAAAEPVEAAPVAAEATTEATGAATGETAAAEPVEAAPVAAEATTEATGAATGETAPVTAEATTEATAEATGSASATVEASASATGTTTEATSIATPLSASVQPGQYSLWDLFSGNIPGMLGETCKLTLLLGGLYLILRGVIDWRIPLSFLATAFVLFWIKTGEIYSLESGSQNALYQLFSGGLFLGAFFMATDYVTSPTTDKGKLIFGIGLGVITCGIRFFGTMNEGVSFAILLMNLMVPYIDVLTRQDKLGIAKAKKEGAAK